MNIGVQYLVRTVVYLYVHTVRVGIALLCSRTLARERVCNHRGATLLYIPRQRVNQHSSSSVATLALLNEAKGKRASKYIPELWTTPRAFDNSLRRLLR
jgi:hypothetical protein